MNRIGVLVVAAVVALGSALGLVHYASGAQDRAVKAAEPVPVMIATKDVPLGMPFSTAWNERRVVLSTIPRTLRPPTAVVDPNALTGTIAAAPITQGQLVVQESFANTAASDHPGPPTFATQLPPGTVAVSFKATAAQAVSDLIRPGDHVNLLVQVPDASVLGLPPSGGAAVVHVFQDLKIIAIGDVTEAPKDATEAPKNPGTGLYTVAVAPEDSARLLLLAHEYDVYLTLVGPKTSSSNVPAIADHDALPPVTTTPAPPANP
ncbi:MAG TPA: Flp pilus assembly protein CpaB [Acidimicrobiales bacterium]|nr:Flp pilus assembly protein CpaB [Acidimicrobiales bacterium]